ncbi:MAG: hypothetical protein DRP80_01490 [Candidatus Omnitrophota bacterium]|nr:MAG: hypothetical protein DRP80_01490 [Candidatus Omnitrophota bacterium]
MKTWRFIQSDFSPAFQNMAYDEALFLNYPVNRQPLLRIYGFSSLSFSLGYFQKTSEVLDWQKCLKEGLTLVRRPTGGGLIFHSQELTYSIVCSKQDLGFRKEAVKREIIEFLCSFLLKFYRKLGLKPYFCFETKNHLENKNSSFCLLRKSVYDVLIEGRKIGGYAQKISKGIILQQGIIPFRVEIEKIKKFVKEPLEKEDKAYTFLEELLGRNLSFKELSYLVKESLEEALNCQLKKDYFNSQECSLANYLLRKYESLEWNIYRNLPENFYEEAFLVK